MTSTHTGQSCCIRLASGAFSQWQRMKEPFSLNGKRTFVLDCSCLSADEAPLLEKGVGVSLVHAFHSYLPVSVSCCGALGWLGLHCRNGTT
jgi:hypothetical protein